MMKFFKKIFNQDKKSEETPSTEPLTENQILDILGKAICDVGYWSWWTTDLPKVIQIEFGGTQLYFQSGESSKPPLTQIAIQFRNPKSISFLTKQEIQYEAEQNWFDKLHNDKIEAPTCSYEYFTFTDSQIMTEILNEAKTINTIHGYSPKDKLFLTEKYKLVFWAGDYGFAVSSDEIKLLTKAGKVDLIEIPKINSDWWAYWKKYWDLKASKNPLPNDYACDVTIPLKNN